MIKKNNIPIFMLNYACLQSSKEDEGTLICVQASDDICTLSFEPVGEYRPNVERNVLVMVNM